MTSARSSLRSPYILPWYSASSSAIDVPVSDGVDGEQVGHPGLGLAVEADLRAGVGHRGLDLLAAIFGSSSIRMTPLGDSAGLGHLGGRVLQVVDLGASPSGSMASGTMNVSPKRVLNRWARSRVSSRCWRWSSPTGTIGVVEQDVRGHQRSGRRTGRRVAASAPCFADLSLNWVMRRASPKPVMVFSTQASSACAGTCDCTKRVRLGRVDAGGDVLRRRAPGASRAARPGLGTVIACRSTMQKTASYVVLQLHPVAAARRCSCRGAGSRRRAACPRTGSELGSWECLRAGRCSRRQAAA